MTLTRNSYLALSPGLAKPATIEEIASIGVAPIYYDADLAVNGVRADKSLAGLVPGQNRDFTITSGRTALALTIESRIIPVPLRRTKHL